MVRKGGPSNLFLSLLVPGLGDYYVRDKRSKTQALRPYWTIALLSYGLVGSGIYFNELLNKKYSEYKKTLFPDHSIYNNANNKHHAYYILTGLGAGIWLSDVLLVGIKGFKNIRHRNQDTSLKTQNTISETQNKLSVEFGVLSNEFGVKFNF
jgi:hypothetical protein